MCYLIFLVCFLVIGPCAGVELGENVKDDGYYQKWVVDDRNSLFPTLPIAAPQSKNDICREDSRLLISHLANKTLWAMQMWDSSVKTPVGILFGSMFQLGNFDECLRVATPIRAQFCVAQIHANLTLRNMGAGTNPYAIDPHPMTEVWRKLKDSEIDPSKVRRDTVNWGLCVPASCTSSDMQQAVNSHLSNFNKAAQENNETTYRVVIPENFCTRSDFEEEYTVSEIMFWTFTFIIVFLTVTSTTVDLLSSSDQKESKLRSVWMFFSAKRNTARLVKCETSEKGPGLDILHGIKFLSIVFVLFGHRVGIFLGMSALNYQEVEEILRTNNNMFFVHSDLVVDTFFFISGLLVCYIMTQALTNRFVNPFCAIFLRITRLAPAYFFILWFQTSAVLRLGSGPLWNIIGKAENQFCVDNWWTNVLFISNYVNSKQMCMPHTWYIPCDLHFFMLAIPLTMILAKNKKFGLFLLTSVTITSVIIPGIVTYIDRLKPLVIFYQDFLAQPRNDESFNVLYIRSHNRATAYLIGMITGYFLCRNKNSVRKIPTWLTLSGCVVWLGLMFAPMAYGSLFYELGRPYDLIEASVFASLRRLSWALAFVVFILCHRFGNIPLLGSLLSSKFAVALSNLTYGIYLIHFNLIMSHVEKLRSAEPVKVFDVIIEGTGDLATCIIYAYFLHITLESPVKQIFKEFVFGRGLKNSSPKEKQESTCTLSTRLEMPHLSNIKL